MIQAHILAVKSMLACISKLIADLDTDPRDSKLEVMK
jgi:hypothetical protein